LPVTLVFDAPKESALLREEIFGPVLPVIACASHQQAIDFMLARPRPLAAYLFDDDRARVEAALARIVAGAVVVNDVMWHAAQAGWPFGGVGASGMGVYHGRRGFESFSKRTPIYRAGRWNLAELLRPPFTALARRMLESQLGRAPRGG
jgi:acyl-CoA reductase-like NAD-dependent aldehyde dehydrogenase